MLVELRLSTRNKPAGVVVEVRCACRVGIMNAGDPAGGVVAPGRPLGLGIGHKVGPTGGVERIGEPSIPPGSIRYLRWLAASYA